MNSQVKSETNELTIKTKDTKSKKEDIKTKVVHLKREVRSSKELKKSHRPYIVSTIVVSFLFFVTCLAIIIYCCCFIAERERLYKSKKRKDEKTEGRGNIKEKYNEENNT